MPTEKKVAVVKEVAEQLKRAKSVFLTDFTGLNVEEINQLRRSCREASVEYRVVKNTLVKRSFESAGCEELGAYLDGPTALAFGLEDPVAPAKVISEFAKKIDKPKIKACLFEGVLVGTDKIEEIANLPGREELLAKLVGTLNAPLYNLAGALGGVLRNFVYVIDAVRREKEK